MKGNWKYGDLIDLEYCLAQDRESEQRVLHERDRQIYLDRTTDDQKNGQGALIYHWLQCRKEQLFAEKKSPGLLLVESFQTLSFVLFFSALAAGLAAGISFFSYSGTTPVNVLNFLFIFVFSQLLMLLFLFLAAGFRLAGGTGLPAPIIELYGSFSAWLLSRSKKLAGHLPAEKRAGYNQLEAMLKKQKTLYGPIFYWPLFRLSQLTMTGFNLGLLAATFFKIVASDLAFGWQSTIQFSTSSVFNMTRTLALPWSWLVPEQYAHPSVAEIEGSRIILKDGIYHLQTQDLVSWWPFLILCLIFYGLLVRLLLLAAGRWGQYRSLRKLKLNTPSLIQVAQRMRSPLVSSRAQTAAAADSASAWSEPADEHDPGASKQPACRLLLLIPADIGENQDADFLSGHLQKQGYSVCGQKSITGVADVDTGLMEEFGTHRQQGDCGVLIIFEAWMPPIKETLSLIQHLRTSLGDQIPIFVGLLGRGSDGRAICRPSVIEKKIWRQKLDQLADPYLSLLDIWTDSHDT